MTRQTKTVGGREGFSRLAAFNRIRVLQIFIFSVIVSQFSSIGRAQGNLVDMYNWANDTRYVSNPSSFVAIDAYNAAYFSSGFTSNGPLFVEPVLSGDLNTTPGVTYDISFILQLDAPDDAYGGASMSFGDVTNHCDLQNPANGNHPGYNPPVSFSFTTLATATATPMSFYAGFGDYTDRLSISGVTVTAVPEVSAFRLLCCGGCLLWVAKRLRGLIQKRKLAFNR